MQVKSFHIAVQTENIRLYHKLLKTINVAFIKLKFFPFSERIPRKYNIIWTTNEEKTQCPDDYRIWTLQLDEVNQDLIYHTLVRLFNETDKKFNKLLIGIDPGKNIGLVAVCDGMILKADTVKFENMLNTITSYFVFFPSEHLSIRVGDKPKYYSNRICNLLLSKLKEIDGFTIELVDEKRSNRSIVNGSIIRLQPDERAAFEIAKRSGEIQTAELIEEIQVPSSIIEQIKIESRKLSKNKITLDKSLAYKVAIGELNINEAIKIKKRSIGLEE